MAAKNRPNAPDPVALNGTEQQQMDLFQNLEKLIASAVSICRLDGSVQCQIGGLITVIEELQRLLRHSFSEIKRLERNLDDQKHTFTNNITNLHYQVKEVQSAVEGLKRESEEAQKTKERSSNQEENVNETVDDDLAPQVSLVDESYGYEEESDGSIGLSQFNEEPTGADVGKEGVTDVVSENEAANDRVPLPRVETSSKNESTSLDDTATSTSEERESALRILRSALSKSDSSDKEKPKKNHRLKGVLTKSLRFEVKSNRSNTLASKKSRNSKSPLVITNQRTSPKTPSQNTKIYRKGTPPTKQFLNRDKKRGRPTGKQTDKIQRNPQKKITPTFSKINKVKTLNSPVKASVSASKRKREVLSKLQRKASLSKKNTKVIAQSPKRSIPLKLKSGARRSVTPTANTSNTKLKAKTSQSFSRGSNEPNTPSKKASTEPEEENPMDKYINLDFLLNANQLMSELVTDPESEEGTLDTASDIERRNIVDLAKLYRLRVRMAGGKCEGDFPVALIKGRESSLPKPGQVDELLYKMKHAMAIRQQILKTKAATNKRKLTDGGNRRNMASPAKKRRF